MPLLNYTTTIQAAKTVNEITEILRKHHASAIIQNYNNDSIESLSFEVQTQHGAAHILLPVNIEAVYKVMQREYNTGHIPHRLICREQAIRIAWRILKDWVEAQMAILDTEMVKMEQIFLPYIIHQSGLTLFEVFENRKMLTTGETNE